MKLTAKKQQKKKTPFLAQKGQKFLQQGSARGPEVVVIKTNWSKVMYQNVTLKITPLKVPPSFFGTKTFYQRNPQKKQVAKDTPPLFFTKTFGRGRGYLYCYILIMQRIGNKSFWKRLCTKKVIGIFITHPPPKKRAIFGVG